MKRLVSSAVLLSVTLVATALFIGTSSSALAAGTLTVDWPENDIDRYVAGMSYFIKWTPGNAGATVKIELLKAGKRTKWITKKQRTMANLSGRFPHQSRSTRSTKSRSPQPKIPAFMTQAITLSPS